MTLSQITRIIRDFRPDPAAYIQNGRGFVDWDFAQVCAYLGYEEGERYARSMRRWYNYERQYKGCNLDITYGEFLAAVDQVREEETTITQSIPS